jgi:hypothetical protein
MARRGYEPKTYELTPDQAAALDLLLAGQTITAAAAAVGVARETVSRWRNSDPAFMGALNSALQSAHDAMTKKLLDARARAIDTLADLLDSDDQAIALKSAAALLRVDIDRPKGYTNPAAIDRDQIFPDSF